MEGFRWTRDLCEVLIYLWQQNDILYDVNHKDFKDKNKKDQAIFDILTELKKLDNTVTVKAIHKKIRTLCSQYANEFKRLKAVDGYEPQLWCFQQLSFLRNRPNPRTSISNIDTTDNSCNLQSISLSIEELNTSGETTPQVPKKKKSIIEAESKLLRLKKLLKNKKPKSYDWLAEQLVYKISRIEDETIRQETVQTIRIILKLNDKDTLENANTKPSVTKKKIKTEENDEDNPLKDVERKVLDFKEIFNTAVDSEYYCLGKRVAEEVCNIQDDYEREQICWTIQSVLQENLQKDKQCQHKNLDIQIST